MRFLDKVRTGYSPFLNKTQLLLLYVYHWHDWFVIHYWAALQGNAQSKNGGRLVCAAKRQNGGQIRLLPNFWFLRKRGGAFQIKVMLGEQNNIVWTPNSKLLLSLMIRARKLTELNESHLGSLYKWHETSELFIIIYWHD